MITAGIDMAAQPKNTGFCLIEWKETRAEIAELRGTATDDELMSALCDERISRLGFDVPLGWPSKFVAHLCAYNSGKPWKEVDGRDLRLRETDKYVCKTLNKMPLSVSTDKIAVPAMRAARLLSNSELHKDRIGTGRVIEVYPAAALIQWNTGKWPEAIEKVLAGIPIDADVKHRELLYRDKDAFDALICALVARAKAIDLCEPIPADYQQAAKTEGWIAVPRASSLSALLRSAKSTYA